MRKLQHVLICQENPDDLSYWMFKFAFAVHGLWKKTTEKPL